MSNFWGKKKQNFEYDHIDRITERRTDSDPEAEHFMRARQNIEAIVAARVNEQLGGEKALSLPPAPEASRPVVPPPQMQSPEGQQSPFTDPSTRSRAIAESDPIQRAAAHARANEAAGERDAEGLTTEAREKLRLAAATEADPIRRALLHSRASE